MNESPKIATALHRKCSIELLALKSATQEKPHKDPNAGYKKFK